MDKFISIAIDGPSGAGKSTVAKQIAKRFNFKYADTGAIYRTVAYAAVCNNISYENENEVKCLLESQNIELKYDNDNVQIMYLNGTDVSSFIRTPQISTVASQISALPVVRKYLLDMQRSLALNNNIVMDGRDIGTVVLPEADIKIFLTASINVRAKRRYDELIDKGLNVELDSILNDMKLRDDADTTRKESPLKIADDAILVDTSNLGLDESIDTICELIKSILE